MRFTKSFLDEIRQRLPVSQVVSKRVKLKKQGREYVGLSPFKAEKTPSFTVNDQKGFYHCFATAEHGDIFTFLMQTQGLTFYEAVEQLAQEAGMQLPVVSEHAEFKQSFRDKLYQIMELSAVFFQNQFKSAYGQTARSYMENRGVSQELIQQFRIGFAPNDKFILKNYLRSQGFEISDMVAAGMLIGGPDIPEPYDRFRNRIMFPITDPKGKVIAFGGRILDNSHPAKYLNSPETPLFKKGFVLYNTYLAREQAYEQNRVVVVEGYMDVISLYNIGIKNAVAPLGTALTEDQLKYLWRMSDEPTLCFDGDSAGSKAANRAVEMALPHLLPGKSLRFSYLPDGLDPDDLIRAQGPRAMHDILDHAKTLYDVLWKKEVDSVQTDTPEKRALLDQRLKSLVGGIQHETVQKNYLREIRQDLYQLERQTLNALREQKKPGQKSGSYRRNNSQVDWRTRQRALHGTSSRMPGQHIASDELISNSLLSQEAKISHREVLLILTIINHPWMLEKYTEDIAELYIENKMLLDIRDGLLGAIYFQSPLDTGAIRAHLQSLGCDVVSKLEDIVANKNDYKFVQPEATNIEVERGWLHLIAMHRKYSVLTRDLADAEQMYYQNASEENYKRLCSLRLELLNTDEAPDDMGHSQIMEQSS